MKEKFLKKEMFLWVAWAILAALFLFFARSMFHTVNQDDYNDPSVELYEVDIYEKEIEQHLTLSENIQQLSLLMTSTSEKEEIVNIQIKDAETDSIVDSAEFWIVPSDGEEQTVEWKITSGVEFPKDIIVSIASSVEAKETVYLCVQKKDFDQVYKENSVEQNAHVRMAVLYSQGYQYIFVPFVYALLLLAGFLFIWKIEKKWNVENIFLVTALLGGVAFVLITPFGQEPDGWVHFTRSMDVSYGNLFAPFWDNNGDTSLFRMPDNINNINYGVVLPGSAMGTYIANSMKELRFSNTIAEYELVGGFASLFYLPQAIGLFLARILGVSSYVSVILGRFVNLLTYVGLSYYGLKKMPVYKNIYMAVALLPMTLYQAASFSYDALLYGLCFIFIALCLHYTYVKQELNWLDVFKLGIILALLLMCKYVYACIGLLVFMIPMKKFSSNKEYWKSFVLALIPVVIMVIYVLPLLFAVSGNADMSAVVTEDTQMTQLQYVMANPLALVKVFINTIRGYFQQYLRQLSILGWLNYSLGNLEMIVPIVLCCIAVLDANEVNQKIIWKNKILEIMAFAVVVAVGMLGLYLVDSYANPVGAGIIAGYQGRYTIPVLILCLAMFSSKHVENKIPNFSYKVIGVMTIMLTSASMSLLQFCY